MSGDKGHGTLWGVWLVATIGLVAWMAYVLLNEDQDQTVFMPGELTSGHHQVELACAACHTDPLGGKEVFQEACMNCHGETRKKPFDSHPASKFRDPRNADRLENIDALRCVTCHTEHRPEMTGANGLTQPRDLCVHCHDDVAEERPSHAGMEFTTCATSGCHNFHNNRSLYTNFLIRHLDDPKLLEEMQVPERQFAQLLDQIADYPMDRFPVQQLALADADAGFAVAASEQSNPHEDWAATAHARSGVNCSACHQVPSEDSDEQRWVEKPTQEVCSSCHSVEMARFKQGKHGMKLTVGLEPLKVSEARQPMHSEAAHESLTCNSCHVAHRYDVKFAAAEACMNCHDDGHTRAYEGSPHHRLWQQELAGDLPPGSGVSCATCHMPRIEFDVDEWFTRVMVDHNQNANLTPNSKMIRSACMSCHGLEFSIDALADQRLIDNNFRGEPSVHVETMDLAAAEKKRRDEESADDTGGMFGF